MTELVCTTNAAIAFDLFKSKGLADFQAAAIIGNLQVESKLDPRAASTSEAAYGIAQWHDPRLSNMVAFAQERGRDPWSFDLQIDWVWRELETVPAYGLEQLKATKTLEDAVVVFQDRFERCGDCHTTARIQAAQSALLACPHIVPPRTGTITPAPAKRSNTLITVSALIMSVATGFATYKFARRG